MATATSAAAHRRPTARAALREIRRAAWLACSRIQCARSLRTTGARPRSGSAGAEPSHDMSTAVYSSVTEHGVDSPHGASEPIGIRRMIDVSCRQLEGRPAGRGHQSLGNSADGLIGHPPGRR